MGLPGWFTVGVILAVIGTLALTRIKADLVAVGAVTALLTARVIGPADALAGFINEGVVANAFLFVVAEGLRQTGAMGLVSGRLLGRPRSVLGAQVRLLLPVSAMSAFIHNIPLMTVLLPVVTDWGRRQGVAPSRLLIPLSYAIMLGGLCTLLGTTTNLLVSGLVAGQAGLAPLRIFDPLWIGLPCATVGLAYILAFSRRWLPDRTADAGLRDDPRAYTIEMIVTAGGPLVGRTIEEAGLRQLPGLFLVEIGREGEVMAAVAPGERLRANDRLVFAGVVESVVDLQKTRGLAPATDQVFKLNSPRSHRCLIEAVVSDSCPLAGKTIREGRFRTYYNAAIIALARNGERVGGKIGDIKLRPGDTLLLEAHPWFLENYKGSRDFFLVSAVQDSTPLRYDRAWVALAIVAAMVVASATGWLTTLNAAMLAAGAMVLTRCCFAAEARRSINWEVLVIMAAMLGVSRAADVTGAARASAEVLLRFAGGNPLAALAAVYVLTVSFGEVMSHYAAVVLVFPLAMAAAHGLQVSPMPFVFAILVAGSCTFATPTGYPTNLMAFGPGGYHFRDYLRFGGPLNVLIGIVTVLIVPLLWPF
jgi:di/tricarboxylate transporter